MSDVNIFHHTFGFGRKKLSSFLAREKWIRFMQLAYNPEKSCMSASAREAQKRFPFFDLPIRA